MSQAKHTPGPWTLSETHRYSYVRGAAAIEAEKYITQRCVDGMSRARAERTRADCRLIAAAPDLLEVLREIIADGVHCEVVPHLHRKALEAIAKVTGSPA